MTLMLKPLVVVSVLSLIAMGMSSPSLYRSTVAYCLNYKMYMIMGVIGPKKPSMVMGKITSFGLPLTITLYINPLGLQRRKQMSKNKINYIEDDGAMDRFLSWLVVVNQYVIPY